MINERARKLGEALVAVKIITPEQLSEAMAVASKENAPSLVIGLLETGLLTFKTFEKFVSSTMGIQSAIVSNRPLVKEIVDLVGFEKMLKNLIYPFGLREEKGQKTIALGMVDPTDQEVIRSLQKDTGCRIIPVLISLPDFKETIKNNFHHNQVDVENKQVEGEPKEEFVVIRAGGGEAIVNQESENSEFLETGNTFKTTTKTVQPKPGWDNKTFQFNPQASNMSGLEFFGRNNKKFREEILAKLDLDPSDAQNLREPHYTREILLTHLKNISTPKLQKIYNSLPIELKVEALINAVIKAGVVNKRDMLVSSAVSLAFFEGKLGEKGDKS